jgi:hypothetical protein
MNEYPHGVVARRFVRFRILLVVLQTGNASPFISTLNMGDQRHDLENVDSTC